MKKFLFALGVVSLVFSSCTSGDSHEIVLNLEEGETYSYYVVGVVDIQQELNGMKMNQYVKASSLINYTVKETSGDDILMEVKYEKVKMYMDMGVGQEIEIDSENPDPSNPASMSLEKMKDHSFSIRISKYGEIIEFIGLDDLTDKVIESMEFDNYMIKNQVRNFLEQTYSEGTLIVAYEPMFNFYPAMSVREGDEWEKENIGENHLGKLETFTYTLESIDDDTYLIEGEGELAELSDPKPIDINGNKIVYHLNGDVTTSFELDAETGWVVNGEIIQSASGINDLTISALGGQEMAVPMKYKSTITFSKDGFNE
ncbi:DUF6263 family protein [Parvicella tangerina]|uniref:Uncharacterized protein n=1 Tax=Parvicella tangerina TaxID=2829795 RepID=A0A916JMP4_9FLAO|nr:DUF6263 family protein [Parvicella tangerina]CAG5080689.1 hypothetical protein CRYO30217_01419 [Parvicella tangerina]